MEDRFLESMCNVKKILFVSYGGGHVNLLLPVFCRFANKAGYNSEYLALTTAGNVLRGKGVPYLGFKDLLLPSDARAIAYGHELVDKEYESLAVPYDESVAYMGLSFWDLAQRHGEKEAYRIYQEEGGRQAFYPITPLRRYLNKVRPDLVIATNSPRAERACIDAATQLGIPSVCIVDLFALQEVRWIGQPDFANKVCVLSEFVRDLMINAGRCQDDVVVTGNPAFDTMAQVQNSRIRRVFRKNKNWGDCEVVILWASNIEPKVHPFSDVGGDPGLPRKVEVQLSQLVKENNNFKVVFRPHPNDPYVPENLPENVEISTTQDDLDTLLVAVDCVVVLSSTVGMQAALMGKPLVNIKLSMFSRDAPYDEMGISVGVDDLGLLNSAILQALAEGQSGKGLPDIGTATDKVVNVIEGMLEEST